MAFTNVNGVIALVLFCLSMQLVGDNSKKYSHFLTYIFCPYFELWLSMAQLNITPWQAALLAPFFLYIATAYTEWVLIEQHLDADAGYFSTDVIDYTFR